MNPAPEVTPLQRKALASLGRNVLHFHRVETILKILLLLVDYDGPVAGLEDFLRERTRKLRKSSLGDLVKELNSICISSTPDHACTSERPHTDMALRFRLETTPEQAQAMRRDLRRLVQERNQLIHQQLAGFDPRSPESCHQLIAMLDEQNNRITAQHHLLQKSLAIQRSVFAELFSSQPAPPP